MLRIAQIVANIVKSICTPSWRLSTRFHEKLLPPLVCVFWEVGVIFHCCWLELRTRPKASCCFGFWPILAGTAPRDDDDGDGLGMMIHFAAPLFLSTSSRLTLPVSLTHSLWLFRNFSFFFLFYFSTPAAWTLIFLLLIIFNDLIYSSRTFLRFLSSSLHLAPSGN